MDTQLDILNTIAGIYCTLGNNYECSMKFIFEHIDIKYMQCMSEDIYIREILAMALPLYALPRIYSLFHKHNV